MPKLRILKEVLQIANNKEQTGRKVLKEVLADCEQQIKRRADMGLNQAICTVPCVKEGLPAYDVAECIQFVVNSLCKSGFDVSVIEGNVLAVCWAKALQREKRDQRKEQKKARAQREKREAAKRAAARKEKEKTKIQHDKAVPPLPPLCNEPLDLFSLPSVKRLKRSVARLDLKSKK
jgi:hypothetical protein